MADNNQTIIKIGETQIVQGFTLKDTNPDTGRLEPFDLTGWTVTLNVGKAGSDVLVFADLPCTVDGDQTANIGRAETDPFDADPDTYENLRKGKFDLEVTGVDPAGGVHYFPKRPGRVYAKMVVEEALA